MLKLQGLFTALITPFNEQGALDENGLRGNIRYQIAHQVDGIVVLGSTGEGAALTDQEKVRVVQISKEETHQVIPLIVGTGGISTEATVRQTRLAEELGADGCLVVTPYYNKPTQEGLYQHYKAVASSVRIPIILYHNPGRTACKMAPQTLWRLSDILAGIKESTGDFNATSEIMEKLHPQCVLLSGDDSLTLPLVALGASGLISTASNLIPQEMKKLLKAALAGDQLTARTLHFQLMPLFRALSIETNPIPLKAAMRVKGMAAGLPRLPLTELSQPHQQLIHQLLHSLVYG